MANAHRRQVARVVEKALTEDELVRFLAQESTSCATGLRNRALLALMATSGLRVSEALGLRTRDIVRDGGAMSVRLRSTKAGIFDLVPVNGEAAQLLERWLERRRAFRVGRDAPVFCTISEGTLRHGTPSREGFGPGSCEKHLSPGRPLSRQYVHALCRRLGERAGIEGKRVSPHSLRHTCGTLVYKHTRDRLKTRKLLRHSNEAITEGYIAAGQLDTRDAVEALPRVTGTAPEHDEGDGQVDKLAAVLKALPRTTREALASLILSD